MASWRHESLVCCEQHHAFTKGVPRRQQVCSRGCISKAMLAVVSTKRQRCCSATRLVIPSQSQLTGFLFAGAFRHSSQPSSRQRHSCQLSTHHPESGLHVGLCNPVSCSFSQLRSCLSFRLSFCLSCSYTCCPWGQSVIPASSQPPHSHPNWHQFQRCAIIHSGTASHAASHACPHARHQPPCPCTRNTAALNSCYHPCCYCCCWSTVRQSGHRQHTCCPS